MLITLEDLDLCYIGDLTQDEKDEIINETGLINLEEYFDNKDDLKIFYLTSITAIVTLDRYENHNRKQENALIVAITLYEIITKKICPITTLEYLHKKQHVINMSKLLAGLPFMSMYSEDKSLKTITMSLKKISPGFSVKYILELFIEYLLGDFNDAEEADYVLSCLYEIDRHISYYIEDPKLYRKMLLCFCERCTAKFILFALNDKDNLLFQDRLVEIYDVSPAKIEEACSNGILTYGIDYVSCFNKNTRLFLQSSADLVFGITRRCRYKWINPRNDVDNYIGSEERDEITERYGLTPTTDGYDIMAEIEEYNKKEQRETKKYQIELTLQQYAKAITKEDQDIALGKNRIRYELKPYYIIENQHIASSAGFSEDEVPF